MPKVYDGIDDALERWIAEQSMFFVATAPLAAGGHVNVSPRGHDSFSGSAGTGSAGSTTPAAVSRRSRICARTVASA